MIPHGETYQESLRDYTERNDEFGEGLVSLRLSFVFFSLRIKEYNSQNMARFYKYSEEGLQSANRAVEIFHSLGKQKKELEALINLSGT